MNNNVCCENEVVKERCVADYEKEISELLVETRGVLASIYCTMTADNYGCDDTGTHNCLMDNVVANRELATQVLGMANDINRILFKN